MADKYYGVYSATVCGNDVGQGVLSVKIDTIYHAGEVVDAWPCLPYGVLFLPKVGDKVWVQFQGGKPTEPVWTGVQQIGYMWPTDPGPPAARMLRSLKDHRLTLDDETPAVEMRFGGKKHAISLTDPAVTLTHDAGHAITLEQGKVSIVFAGGGPTVELEQSSVTVSLGGSSVKLDPTSVTVNGPLVKLGGGSKPVIRQGDFGVGNLGAPVAMMMPTQFSVLA